MTVSRTVPSDFDALLSRVSRGASLSPDELTQVAASPDILQLGMLADAARRHLNGTRVSFLRVALVDAAKLSAADPLPSGAREARVVGSPETLDAAIAGISALRQMTDGTISGLSWSDVTRWSAVAGGHAKVLNRLRAAGLDLLAEVSLDQESDLEDAITAIADAGFPRIRLTITKAASISERLPQFLRAAELSARVSTITAFAPLPLSINPLRPTTGYDDVKAVALARLAVPQIPHIQVDWLRYGPKLAQVALTFGADDLDNVSASDAAPDGHRRSPIEELRRNVESAGFSAVERDGRFALIA